MNSLISPQKQLGMGLLFFGLLFLFLGVILFFDRFLLAVGNLLFLSSFPVLIGLYPALNFFNPFYGGDGRFKGKKVIGTTLFFLGCFFVCFLGCVCSHAHPPCVQPPLRTLPHSLVM